MDERPESITVLSWLVLVFCGFGYLSCLFIWAVRDMPAMQVALSRTHVSFAVYIGILLTHVTIHTLCAVGFLLRIGWARYIYVATGSVAVAYGFWTSPYPLFTIPSVLYLLGVTVFLFRPVANRWFAGNGLPSTPA